jgi:hypothetical protein
MIKYTVQAFDNNANIEWEINNLSIKEAEKTALEESKANPELNIFVVFADGYLNIDGHSPVGKKW